MKITPLPQGFGARIEDFDVRAGRDPDDIARLRQAYREHHLLVFAGEGRFEPERQIEIAGWFGPVVRENGQAWTVLDNADTYGRVVLGFHSDIEFMGVPLLGLTLYPEEMPPYRTSTTFISTALGWRSLPEALQAELHDCTARHVNDGGGMRRPLVTVHPVRMVDPTTGEPVLFISQHHVDRIDGLAEGRSAELLPRLFDVLYAPERQYEHVWQTGDLLVFNNRAIQHARTEEADPARGRRVMRRVQIGEIGFLAQMERLAPAEEPAN